MLEHILTTWANLQLTDILVIGLNVLLFLFAGNLLDRIQGSSNRRKRPRMLTLRSLSFLLLLLYLLALIPGIRFGISDCGIQDCGREILDRLTETGATLIISYILMLLAHQFVIKRFGREREVQGEMIHYETYQSRLISIVILTLVTAFLLLTTLTIWGVEDWLRQTTVLGGLAVAIYFTKDLWLPDNINGLILLYKTDVVPGTVVRVRKLELLAVTLRTSLIETAFRDLVHGQRIVIPNAMFRNQVIEVINHDDNIKDLVEFKIGYDTPPDAIREFLQQVFSDACELDAGIKTDSEPRINVVETGDHAVTWRLTYTLENPYRILKAKMAVTEAALLASAKFDIGLNTPLTHRILTGEPPQSAVFSASDNTRPVDT